MVSERKDRLLMRDQKTTDPQLVFVTGVVSSPHCFWYRADDPREARRTLTNGNPIVSMLSVGSEEDLILSLSPLNA